jgi:hypothetical protein
MASRLKSRMWKPLGRWSLLLAGSFFSLLNNPLLAQTGPGGSFKIESVEGAQKPDSDEVDVSEFVVSTKDPQRKELLDEHPGTTHVSFHVSPNEKWIYESLSYGSRMNGAQLFKCGDGLKFEPLQRDFEEAVWEFFGKEEKIEKSRVPYFAGDSHEGIIDFVAWSRDSNRILLALRVGDFDGERQHGVYLWYVYFNTRDGKFELTDRLRSANKGAWKRWENFGRSARANLKN